MEVTGSSGQWIFPVDGSRNLEVEGPLGITVVRLDGGSARVLDSPCPEKICIKTGNISRPGQTIACLPNRVMVVIRGATADEIDAFSF